MTILFLTILIRRFRKWKAQRQLKWQQALASNGIGMRTELLEVKQERNPLKDYVRFCLVVRVRVNGKVVCRQVRTILKEGGVLYTGEKVHIRYNPTRMDLVLLCREMNN
jgi:hypothetical protein